MLYLKSVNTDVHSFTLDLHNGTDVKLNFKQNDHIARILQTTFTSHDDYVDLTNARVDLWVHKKDGTQAVKQADIIDVNNGVVEIALTRQMLAIMPNVRCEYVITYETGAVLTFPIFTIQLEESLHDEDKVVSSDEFSLFFNSLVRMENWIKMFNEKYNAITKVFKDKLDSVTNTFNQKHEEVTREFNQLHEKLETEITNDYNTLKSDIQEHFTEKDRALDTEFSIKGREIEKRFNMLEQKATEQCDVIEEKMNISVENTEIILANRKESDTQLEIILNNTQESREQLDRVNVLADETEQRIENLEGRMDEFDAHYAQAKADELLRIEAENARRNAEDTRVSQENIRVNSERVRVANEEVRVANEEIRENAEHLRQLTFEQAEVVRNNAETERMANEEERQKGYAEMQEQMIEFDEIINPFSASISVSPSVSEKGSTVSEITAKWSYNKDIVSQLIDGVVTSIDNRSKTLTGEFTTDKTVALKATSKTNRTVTVSAKLAFKNGVYYGVSSSTTYNSVLVNSLTKVLDENKARTITVNAGVGQYVYYSYPSRLGTASFNVGGFDGGFNEVARIQFTNASGYTEEYIIYKSTNANLGNTTVVIK